MLKQQPYRRTSTGTTKLCKLMRLAVYQDVKLYEPKSLSDSRSVTVRTQYRTAYLLRATNSSCPYITLGATHKMDALFSLQFWSLTTSTYFKVNVDGMAKSQLSDNLFLVCSLAKIHPSRTMPVNAF